MKSKIIFPNEEKMKVEDLEILKNKLNKFCNKKTVSDKTEIVKFNNCLSEIQGYILVADRKKLLEYFNNFYKLNFLDIFNQILDLKNNNTFKILEIINFFISNIHNNEFLQHLYNKKYPSNIPAFPGIQMNIIDKLILIKFNDYEFLTFQINFIKSLALKIDKDTIQYFYDSNKNFCPIIIKVFSLYNNNTDPLIKNVAKNILLTFIKIDNKNLRDFLISFPINLYYSNIIFEFKNTIIKLCSIDYGENIKKNYNLMSKYHDFLYDTVLYLSDLLNLNIKNINYILINCLLNEIILPLIYSIVQYQNQEYITIYHSLYILSLILYTIKNESIYNIITYFLFKEEIPKSLYESITKANFNTIDEKFMKNINILINKGQHTDNNDPNLEEISNIMKNNGINLSNGEIDFENKYDFNQNLINSENEKIKNPIFENIKFFFLCYDETIILNLNLIINTCIQHDNSNEEGNNNNSILNNKLFEIDINDNKSENIFNHLINYLNSSKNYRIATNEIILYNIQLLINISLKINNNQEYKIIIGKKLLNIFKNEISKMKKLIEKDPNTLQYLFDAFSKAFEYYVKNINKKVNDLITLSNIIVPIIYLEEIENIPKHLKQDKYCYDYLKNYLFKIFFLNDLINEIFDNQKDIIKNQNKCPFRIDTFTLILGEEYKFDDLGEECYHCKILKNNKFVNAEAIFSADTLYFGEIKSGKFEDLSKIKIFKKIPFKYLEFKKTKDKCLLNIFDKTNKYTYNNCIEMNGLNADNTKNIFNYFLQTIFNYRLLEQNLFNTFIDDISQKINQLILE